jgi:AcrR family transcriptional regulator
VVFQGKIKMAPRTAKQYEEMKHKKSSLIIDTALLRFSEDGYKSTSMQSIAKEANVSKGNLYNYFESKEALLESVLRYGLDQFSEFYEQISSGISSEKKFEHAIRSNFDMIKSNKVFWKLYFNLISQPTAQLLFAKIIGPFLEEYMMVFETYFRKKGDKNPAVTALLLGSTMDGVSLGYIMMGEMYPLDDIIDQLIEKFK